MKSQRELKNIAAMLSDDITSVTCVFHEKNDAKKYTFKCTVKLANTLKTGDYVLVEQNQKVEHSPIDLRMAKVVSIDKECILDHVETTDYMWVVTKVDTAELKELHEWENELARQLQTKQRKHAKQQMLDAMGANGISLSLPAPGVDDAEVIDDAD